MAKILIIEDDADISAIERDYLELSGYQVAICADGTAGLSAALMNWAGSSLQRTMSIFSPPSSSTMLATRWGRTASPSAASCGRGRTSPS